MAAEFWARLSGVWRKAQTIYFRSGGVWRLAQQVYYRTGGTWQLVYQNPAPTLTGMTAVAFQGIETSDVQVTWSITGNATGWTAYIDTAFAGDGSFVQRYSGANGGSLSEILNYWGNALTPPADPGQDMLTEGVVRVRLQDGGGNHAAGSPRTVGPGLPTS